MNRYIFIVLAMLFSQLGASEKESLLKRKEPVADIAVKVHAREKKDPIDLKLTPDSTVGDLKKQLVGKQSVPLEQLILCAVPKEGSLLVSPRLADNQPVKEVVEEYTSGFVLLKKTS